MTKNARIAIWAVFALCAAPLLGAEPAGFPTPDQSWKRAMDLSDQKRYDEALTVLHGALGHFPDNTDLRWLQAGVLGWSGRHEESVAVFEELVSDHPELADDVRADLATQRLWAGDARGALAGFELRLEEHPSDRSAARMRALALAHAGRLARALEAHDELLADEPGDPELGSRRAMVLSWMGRYEQAAAAYREVLQSHPGHAEARAGLAENENWRGNHRKAASMFHELSEGNEPNPWVLKGLAYASYWADRPEEARLALDRFRALRPGDRDGINLDRLLVLEDHQAVTGGFAASDDSDDLRIETFTLDYRLPLPHKMAVSVLVRDDEVRDPGGSHDLRRIGAGFEKRWSDRFKAEAFVFHYDPGEDRSERGLVRASFAYRPGDRFGFDASVEQEPVLTRLSQDLDVRTTNVRAGMEWMVVDRVTLNAAVYERDYSDGNGATQVAAGGEWDFFSHRKHRIALTFGGDYLTTDLDLDNGYYDPDRYTELGPGVEWVWESPKNLTVGARVRTGYQKQRGSERDTFYHLVGVAEIPLGRMFRLDMLVERGDFALSAASGFEQTRGAVYLTRAF